MAAREDYLLSFNRGIVSKYARNRADIKRVALSAERQMNWIPRTLGPMSVRPGWKYIGTTAHPEGHVKLIPFIFSLRDTAIIEITEEGVRVYVNDEIISRPEVDVQLLNYDFTTGLMFWTGTDEGAAVSVGAGSQMLLTGTGSNAAQRWQVFTPVHSDREHALRVGVAQGTLQLRVGTSQGEDDILRDVFLPPGVHSISLGNLDITGTYIQLSNRADNTVAVDSCEIEAAGIMNLAPGVFDSGGLDAIRNVQSADVVYLARGLERRPGRIERRGKRSWSVVEFTPDTGPMRVQNTSDVTLAPSGRTGEITLVASRDIFRPSNIGSLYSLESVGQVISANLGAFNDASGHIRVAGILGARIFSVFILGTFSGTVTLQQSLGEPGNWIDVPGQSWTASVTTTHQDGLDNQIAFYRLVMTAYISGDADVSLSIATGSIKGMVRITGVASETQALATVIKPLGGTAPTRDWAEGEWSPRRGFPTAVAIHESRLYWAGRDKVIGSVVDDFLNYDADTIGDAGPVNRTIGSGPVDNINWLVSLRQLAIGGEGAEFSASATGFDEPITPSNFKLRVESTYGSSSVDPIKLDNSVLFVDRTGVRVMQTESLADTLETKELTVMIPEIGEPNIKRVTVQRRPDTRVHFMRCDGTVVLNVFDPAEEVNGFVTVETQGLIDDMVVLPGNVEDQVYYAVIREVNGQIVRYLEKWAMLEDAVGGQVNKMADAFVEYTGLGSDTLTGLDHLEGAEVSVWADGADLGLFTVAGGVVTLPSAVGNAIAGLPYFAEFISGKLEFATEGPAGVSRRSRVISAGLLLQDTHADGLLYGTDVDHLDMLPKMDNEAVTPDGTIFSQYDENRVSVNGTFNQATKLVLRSVPTRPCTVLAVVLSVEGSRI